MGGGKKTIEGYEALVSEISSIGRGLGLTMTPDVCIKEMPYGVYRTKFTVPIKFSKDGKELMVDCISQRVSGSAEKKFLEIAYNMHAAAELRYDTCTVFSGNGFSQNGPGMMMTTFGAIPLRQLRNTLKDFFRVKNQHSPIPGGLEEQDIERGTALSKVKCKKCGGFLTNQEFAVQTWDEQSGYYPMHSKCAK